MDQGYNLEAAELAEKAINRLNVVKEVLEHDKFKNNLNKDEAEFAEMTQEWCDKMTDIQKNIVFMRVVQGFSFVGIADLQGRSESTIKTNFYQACKKSRHFKP
jgi:DNA-directed RNA polymerase specialized sigma24 family protein